MWSNTAWTRETFNIRKEITCLTVFLLSHVFLFQFHDTFNLDLHPSGHDCNLTQINVVLSFKFNRSFLEETLMCDCIIKNLHRFLLIKFRFLSDLNFFDPDESPKTVVMFKKDGNYTCGWRSFKSVSWAKLLLALDQQPKEDNLYNYEMLLCPYRKNRNWQTVYKWEQPPPPPLILLF